MDKTERESFQEAAASLGAPLDEQAVERFFRLREELLKWNQKVNLTAITDPTEVLEKHFLDCLAVAPLVPPSATVLDVGSGAGFPGLPLAIARPDVTVQMVDSAAKKVAFANHAAAMLGLAPRARASHVRLTGKEEWPPSDVVVARALMDLPAWLALAGHYVRPGGKVVAMLAAPPKEPAAESRSFELPWSHAPRVLATFHVQHAS